MPAGGVGIGFIDVATGMSTVSGAVGPLGGAVPIILPILCPGGNIPENTPTSMVLKACCASRTAGLCIARASMHEIKIASAAPYQKVKAIMIIN